MKKLLLATIATIAICGCSKIDAFEFVGKAYLQEMTDTTGFVTYLEYAFITNDVVTKTYKTYNHDTKEWGPYTSTHKYNYKYLSYPDLLEIDAGNGKVIYAQFLDINTAMIDGVKCIRSY